MEIEKTHVVSGEESLSNNSIDKIIPNDISFQHPKKNMHLMEY